MEDFWDFLCILIEEKRFMNEANRNHRSFVANWRKLRDKRPSSLLGRREIRERVEIVLFHSDDAFTNEMLRARTEWL